MYSIKHGSCILAFLISTISAATINVPADYSSIQDALNAAQSNDSVLVQPGTYVENISWPSSVNGIKLIGQGSAEEVTVDGSGSWNDPVFDILGGATPLDSSTVISNLTVTNGTNSNGGGFHLYYCGPTLKNLIVTGNTASQGGGGLYLSTCDAVLSNLTITGNSAGDGGGISVNNFLWDGNQHLLKWHDIDIIDNSASDDAGGILIEYAELEMNQIRIEGNSCAGDGGGMKCSNSASVSIDDFIVRGNSAFSGGGLYGVYGRPITLENGEIKNNSADFVGGISSGGALNLSYVTISGNVSSYTQQGCGIYKSGGSSNLVNVTLVNNRGGSGLKISTGISPEHNIANSIVWNNGIYLLQSNATISYSDIEGGEEGIGTYWPATVTWGEGNIDLNPIFCDTSTGDFTLAQNSPCLDSGLNGSHMGALGQGCGPIDIAPDAPRNLTAAAGNGEVVLTWNPNIEEDFLRYRIYGDTIPVPTLCIDSTAGILDTVKTIAGLLNEATYHFRITAVDLSLQESSFSNVASATPSALALSESQEHPNEYALHQNYPNPFNATSTIRYNLARATHVRIIVFDVEGHEVERLVDTSLEPGAYQTTWNGEDNSGRDVPSGLYIARMLTPEFTKSIKMVLLR